MADRNFGSDADSADMAAMFGFEAVDPATKTARVRGVFDSVASRYDLMNDLMSAGMHRLWKRMAVELLDLRPRQRVLDLAAGTADLTALIAARGIEDLELYTSDINRVMLEAGRDKLLNQGRVAGVRFVQANAETLPFATSSLHRVIIGFGLRNVTTKQAALNEMSRVLVPGGKVIILEFSTPRSGAFAAAYDRYSFEILPRLGQWVAGDGDSYRYLAESIRVHPDQEALSRMMRQADLGLVHHHNLIRGAVAIHVGRKP